MDITELVRQVFLILTGNSICLILLDKKYSLKKTLFIYGIATVAVIVLNLLILFLLGREIFFSSYPIMINGIMLASLFCLSKRKGFPVLFTMLTSVIISALISMPGYYLAQATGLSIRVEILLKITVAMPIILFLYRYLRPSYLQMHVIIKKGWGYLCLIPGLYYTLALPNIITLSSAPSKFGKIFPTLFLALLIVIVSYGVIFVLFARIVHETKMRDEQQLLKIQIQAMERQIDMLKESEEKVCIYRHDLKHYIADVKILLEAGNTEEALHVLGNFDEQNRNPSVLSYCDNPTVNAILVYYIQKAEYEGITVETDCRLPERLPIEASELAMVLANAIENAIHACDRVPEDRERFIKIKTVSSPHLALEVVNSYAGTVEFNEEGLPISSEAEHGLGTKSISAFVERYDGILKYSADGTMFRLRMLVEV